MMGSTLLAGASDAWAAVTGSLTLAVFSAIFAAMGYGIHEIRKVRNRIHELRVEHEELRREVQEELVISDLGGEGAMDRDEEPRFEDRGDPTPGTTNNPSDEEERGEG